MISHTASLLFMCACSHGRMCLWTWRHAVHVCLQAYVVGFLGLLQVGSSFFYTHACVGLHVCMHVIVRIKVLCLTYFGVCGGDAVHPPCVVAVIVLWSLSHQPHTHSSDRQPGSRTLLLLTVHRVCLIEINLLIKNLSCAVTALICRCC